MAYDISGILLSGYFDEVSPLQSNVTRYKVDACLAYETTDFCTAAIVNSPDYGRMLFLDGELQSSSYDEAIYHETLVHPIMGAYADTKDKRVLVIGGAEGATVREVLKWSDVKTLEWVDIDGRLIDLCKQHMRFCDAAMYDAPNLHLFVEDIMVHLGRITDPTYDIIIIDLPDPDPAMDGPLYGAEFWSLVHRSLKPGGGIVTHCGPVDPGVGKQEGLKIIQDGAGSAGFPYHTFIPSFQGHWGFWMNRAPAAAPAAAETIKGCKIMNPDYLRTIFHWDAHWFS
jgi:spermidine synthase